MVAELGDVRARVAVRVERAAAEQDVQEVGRCRIVGEPVGERELHLVLRVLDERVLDVVGQELRRCLVPELVQKPDEVETVRLVHIRRVGVDLDRRPLCSRLVDELLRLG